MVLSDKTIRQYLQKNKITINPIDKNQIQPASVDLRLSNHYLTIDESQTEYITLNSSAKYREIISDEIIIPSRSFVLATTQEYISLPDDITGFIEGRSSIGRLGLFIENAGWVDPGFEGQITLELFNANIVPIKLQAYRRICQIVFVNLDQHCQNPYQGKYQKQKLATASKIYQDQEISQIKNK